MYVCTVRPFAFLSFVFFRGVGRSVHPAICVHTNSVHAYLNSHIVIYTQYYTIALMGHALEDCSKQIFRNIPLIYARLKIHNTLVGRFVVRGVNKMCLSFMRKRLVVYVRMAGTWNVVMETICRCSLDVFCVGNCKHNTWAPWSTK